MNAIEVTQLIFLVINLICSLTEFAFNIISFSYPHYNKGYFYWMALMTAVSIILSAWGLVCRWQRSSVMVCNMVCFLLMYAIYFLTSMCLLAFICHQYYSNDLKIHDIAEAKHMNNLVGYVKCLFVIWLNVINHLSIILCIGLGYRCLLKYMNRVKPVVIPV